MQESRVDLQVAANVAVRGLSIVNSERIQLGPPHLQPALSTSDLRVFSMALAPVFFRSFLLPVAMHALSPSWHLLIACTAEAFGNSVCHTTLQGDKIWLDA